MPVPTNSLFILNYSTAWMKRYLFDLEISRYLTINKVSPSALVQGIAWSLRNLECKWEGLTSDISSQHRGVVIKTRHKKGGTMGLQCWIIRTRLYCSRTFFLTTSMWDISSLYQAPLFFTHLIAMFCPQKRKDLFTDTLQNGATHTWHHTCIQTTHTRGGGARVSHIHTVN